MTRLQQPQLDLFADSRDVMLRNDAIDAVLRRDPVAASSAREALVLEDPQHPVLSALDVSIVTLNDPLAEPFGRHQAAAGAVRQLREVLAPAAQALLGAAAADWLHPAWGELARRAAPLPYAAEHVEVHAAALWLQAHRPAQAVVAVQGIPSWRRIPAALGWMLQARHATEGLDACWPLLVELAWLAPGRLEASARDLANASLARLLQRFDSEFDVDADVEAAAPADAGSTHALAWFPAWLANDKPALLPHLRLAEPGQGTLAEQAFRRMVEALGLERQGRHAELMLARKRLRDLHPGLYACYMRTR